MYTMSIVVAVLVIILFAIVYIVLFFQLFNAQSKVIPNGLDDKKIIYDMIKDYECFKKKGLDLKTGLKKRTQHEKLLDKIYMAIAIIVLLASASVMTFALVTKGNGNLIYFGDTTYLVIETNSMSDKSSVNTYLDDNDLDNQFSAGTMIGITKQETYKLYDIAAFWHEGQVIVHRIIDVRANQDGDNVYTFRGDANPASMSWEVGITDENIIGAYNGFNSLPLGAWILYFQNGIGVLSVVVAIIVISFYFYFYRKIEIMNEKRYKALMPNIEYYVRNKDKYEPLPLRTRFKEFMQRKTRDEDK